MVQTAGGAVTDDITFTSTINGAQVLTLTAGVGDVLLSGIVGGTTPLQTVTIIECDDGQSAGDHDARRAASR